MRRYLLQREDDSHTGQEDHGKQAVPQDAGHAAEGNARHAHQVQQAVHGHAADGADAVDVAELDLPGLTGTQTARSATLRGPPAQKRLRAGSLTKQEHAVCGVRQRHWRVRNLRRTCTEPQAQANVYAWDGRNHRSHKTQGASMSTKGIQPLHRNKLRTSQTEAYIIPVRS